MIMMAERILGMEYAVPEDVGMSTQRLARVRPVFERVLKDGLAPGFVTVVARRGRLVHCEAIGYQRVASGTAMSKDTIFRLHSQTKPIIGAAVMGLFEEGWFGLNDPIAAFLPEFAKMEVLREDGSRVPAQQITIKHLLTHTAGLSYYLYPETPVGRLYLEAGLVTNLARLDGTTTADYVRKIASLPLVAQPGTRWNYSEAMTVLGRLIEVVSGISLGEYLHARLFEPLGMTDTAFWVPPGSIDRLATQYTLDEKGDLVEIGPEDLRNRTPAPAQDYSKPPVYEAGSSGLVSTAIDYLRFAQMLLNGGELDGVRILSPTSVDAMMTNYLGPEFGDRPLESIGIFAPSNRGIGFGFCGFVVTDISQAGWTGSDGEYSWGGAASTDFWIDRKQQLIGLVMTQVVPTGSIPSRERMHQMTYQAIVD